MIRALALVMLSGLLAACSNDPDGQGASRATFGIVLDRLGKLASGGEAPPPFGITRALIADYPDPLIVATVPTGKAGLIFAGQNGPWRSWQTPDGIGFTTRAGVLTATRGFGDDLLAVEASGIVDRITARSEGTARRVERRLDSDHTILIQHFACDIRDEGPERIEVFEVVHATRKLTESCRGAQANGSPEQFNNTYWVGANGTVWRSDQRVGPRAGRVILEQLIE